MTKFCQTRAPITEAKLSAHAAARLSAYKRPDRIIITEGLSVTANGKVLKHKLAEVLARQFIVTVTAKQTGT